MEVYINWNSRPYPISVNEKYTFGQVASLFISKHPEGLKARYVNGIRLLHNGVVLDMRQNASQYDYNGNYNIDAVDSSGGSMWMQQRMNLSELQPTMLVQPPIGQKINIHIVNIITNEVYRQVVQTTSTMERIANNIKTYLSVSCDVFFFNANGWLSQEESVENCGLQDQDVIGVAFISLETKLLLKLMNIHLEGIMKKEEFCEYVQNKNADCLSRLCLQYELLPNVNSMAVFEFLSGHPIHVITIKDSISNCMLGIHPQLSRSQKLISRVSTVSLPYNWIESATLPSFVSFLPRFGYSTFSLLVFDCYSLDPVVIREINHTLKQTPLYITVIINGNPVESVAELREEIENVKQSSQSIIATLQANLHDNEEKERENRGKVTELIDANLQLKNDLNKRNEENMRILSDLDSKQRECATLIKQIGILNEKNDKRTSSLDSGIQELIPNLDNYHHYGQALWNNIKSMESFLLRSNMMNTTYNGIIQVCCDRLTQMKHNTEMIKSQLTRLKSEAAVPSSVPNMPPPQPAPHPFRDQFSLHASGNSPNYPAPKKSRFDQR